MEVGPDDGAAAPSDDLVPVTVAEVSVAVPAGNGIEAGMVVLQEVAAPYRRLRMYVGQPEARAIRVAWRGEVPPRPSTWDLFVSTISVLGGQIRRAVVDRVEEGRHYFAHVVVDRDGQELVVTARPSDALALALRTYGARLFALRPVLDDAGVDDAGQPVVPPPVPLPPPPIGPDHPAAAWAVVAAPDDPSPSAEEAPPAAKAPAARKRTPAAGKAAARKATQAKASDGAVGKAAAARAGKADPAKEAVRRARAAAGPGSEAAGRTKKVVSPARAAAGPVKKARGSAKKGASSARRGPDAPPTGES